VLARASRLLVGYPLLQHRLIRFVGRAISINSHSTKFRRWFNLSHSRTVNGADISKIGKLAGIILLVSTPLAYGQFFTYSEWKRLPEELRQVYLAGAFDTVVGIVEAEDPWGLNGSLHYQKCIRDSHMTLRQLSQNVIAFAATNPELQGMVVVQALLLYLQSLCGLVPK
jgi:hypothetical protein